MHDLAIKNVLLLDGTGNPGVIGSLAVTGDRISAVGAEVGPAKQVIDAQGLALMPGIIDGHTHR
jgi:N-acyl-D-amino-acid deacylase